MKFFVYLPILIILFGACRETEYISPQYDNDGLDIMQTKYPNLDANNYKDNKIDLSYNNLTSINYHIVNYSNIACLLLNNNLLTILPDSIHLLNSLGVLYLNDNYLNSFPKKFYQLNNLG